MKTNLNYFSLICSCILSICLLQAHFAFSSHRASGVFPAIPFSGLNDTMEYIQGGTFRMGNQVASKYEKLGRRVEVADFYLSKYELTVQEYLAFANETKSHYPQWLEANSPFNIHTGTDDHYKKLGSALQDEDHPIVGISWEDANAYCAWLSEKKGVKYRLPTEAEWEYAARGGQLSKGYQYAGSDSLGQVAWNLDNAENFTHAVGTKAPNELGLFDMSGNVYELCKDWFKPVVANSNTRHLVTVKKEYRVIRGGSWCTFSAYCLLNSRLGHPPTGRDLDLGFRIARSR